MLKSYTMEEFGKLKLPHEPWLIPGLLPGGGWTLLMAPSKAGKSILALQLVDSLTTDSDFLSFRHAPIKGVFYLQADAPASDWQGQIQVLAPESQARTVILPELCLSQEKLRIKLAELLKVEHARFVVWDALYKLGAWDTNTQEGTRAILQAIKSVHPGLPFMLIHHPAKWTVKPEGEGAGVYAAAGSFALVSDASAVWALGSKGLTITGRGIRTMTLPIVQGESGRWERRKAAPLGGILGL